MPKVRSRDRVTVAFHYFDIKSGTDEEGEDFYEGFDKLQLEEFRGRLLSLDEMDLSKEEIFQMLRTKRAVPIDDVQQIDDRTFFGRYRGAYWGHGYTNTHAGYIPPESVSLRPFFFLLYFSTDGKIYLGCQYLGQFGSYTGLKNTLIRLLPRGLEVAAHSFRSETANLENVVPKEVRVTVASIDKNANSDNMAQSERITVLKKVPRGSKVQADIKKSLISRFKQPEKLRQEVSNILRRDRLIAFDDDDIVDCVVVADLDGRPFTLHFMQEGTRASQFEIKRVTYELDGHPNGERVRDGAIKILEERILSKSKNA